MQKSVKLTTVDESWNKDEQGKGGGKAGVKRESKNLC